MQQSPSSEADSPSISQEIPQHFTEPEDSLPCSQQSPTGPYLKQWIQSTTLQPI
jgi:hypothetical protein